MTREEREAARKARTNGGIGAPAEAPAPDVQQPMTPAETPPEQVTSAPHDIPPNAQADVAVDIDPATLDSETLKRAWIAQSEVIRAAEQALKREQDKRVAISTILGRRALDARKAATGSERGAKVEIDGHKYKPRERRAAHGGGIELSRIDDSAADV